MNQALCTSIFQKEFYILFKAVFFGFFSENLLWEQRIKGSMNITPNFDHLHLHEINKSSQYLFLNFLAFCQALFLEEKVYKEGCWILHQIWRHCFSFIMQLMSDPFDHISFNQVILHRPSDWKLLESWNNYYFNVLFCEIAFQDLYGFVNHVRRRKVISAVIIFAESVDNLHSPEEDCLIRRS